MKHVFLNGVAVLALALPCSGNAQEAESAPPAAAARRDPADSAGRVKQALQQAQGLRASDISVTVHGETVILGGKVDSPAQAAAAVRVAQAAVEGVRVYNQLEVRAPEETPADRRDEKLVRDVEAALRADARTASLGVAVSMDESGVIGLHGLVPSQDSRAAAERVAAQVTGTRRLRNHLAIPGEQ
jgi:osmotically-inducible protein OsmY